MDILQHAYNIGATHMSVYDTYYKDITAGSYMISFCKIPQKGEDPEANWHYRNGIPQGFFKGDVVKIDYTPLGPNPERNTPEMKRLRYAYDRKATHRSTTVNLYYRNILKGASYETCTDASDWIHRKGSPDGDIVEIDYSPLLLRIAPRDMRCFDKVYSVIGEAAKEELQRVIDSMHTKGYCIEDMINKPLVDAFNWKISPQGDTFWQDINKGHTPRGYVQTTGNQFSQGITCIISNGCDELQVAMDILTLARAEVHRLTKE